MLYSQPFQYLETQSVNSKQPWFRMPACLGYYVPQCHLQWPKCGFSIFRLLICEQQAPLVQNASMLRVLCATCHLQWPKCKIKDNIVPTFSSGSHNAPAIHVPLVSWAYGGQGWSHSSPGCRPHSHSCRSALLWNSIK